MVPKLHSMDASPPCRAVLLTSKALGVSLDIIECSVIDRQHLTPEFLKLNPGRTIPTMEDGDFVLANSHAISIYLVDKYGKDHSLYPKEITERAKVNHRLFFDEGTAFPAALAARKVLLFGRKQLEEMHKEKIIGVYKIIEIFLQDKEWIAGDNLTIADFHLVATITTSLLLVPANEKDYPNMFSWIAKCDALPYFDINRKGLNDFKSRMYN